MSDISLCFTGENYGVGKSFIEKGGVSLSSKDGFDIRTSAGRNNIVSESHNYDIFINHIYGEQGEQLELLALVSDSWKMFGKGGHIFNTGSMVTHVPDYFNLTPSRYNSNKHATDEYCKGLYIKWKQGIVKYKTTNIKMGDFKCSKHIIEPGSMVTECKEYYDLIMWLYNTPENTLIGEIVMEIMWNGLPQHQKM